MIQLKHSSSILMVIVKWIPFRQMDSLYGLSRVRKLLPPWMIQLKCDCVNSIGNYYADTNWYSENNMSSFSWLIKLSISSMHQHLCEKDLSTGISPSGLEASSGIGVHFMNSNYVSICVYRIFSLYSSEGGTNMTLKLLQ